MLLYNIVSEDDENQYCAKVMLESTCAIELELESF